MTDYELERHQLVPRGLDEVFAFFADPANLEAITPPWLRFHVVDAPARLEEGAVIVYRLRLLGVPFRWRARIDDWRPPDGFTDRQLTGPYPLWIHTHRFREVEGGTEVHDHVRYRVPGGPLGALVRRAFVAPRLDAIFDYRRDALRELLG